MISQTDTDPLINEIKVFAIECDEMRAISMNLQRQIAEEMGDMLTSYLKKKVYVIMVPKPFKLIDADTATKMLKELQKGRRHASS